MRLVNDSIYFMEDGTVRFNKPNSEEGVAYTAINIGTLAKGPLYTLVRGIPRLITKGLKYGYVKMNYGIRDTPLDEGYDFETIAEFMNDSSPYSFYPLIRQLLNANEFLANQSDDDHFIHVGQIHIEHGGSLNLSGEFKWKKISKEMDKLGLKTDVASASDGCSYLMVESNQPIFAGKKRKRLPIYKFTDDIHFDGTGYHDMFVLFPEIESMYRVSPYSFGQISSLSMVSVNVFYEPKFLKCEDVSISDFVLRQKIDQSYEKSYDAITVDQIFKLCIYVPQLIKIERSLYDMDVTVTITLECKGNRISLTVGKDEYTSDFSLFNVIQRLLSII